MRTIDGEATRPGRQTIDQPELPPLEIAQHHVVDQVPPSALALSVKAELRLLGASDRRTNVESVLGELDRADVPIPELAGLLPLRPLFCGCGGRLRWPEDRKGLLCSTGVDRLGVDSEGPLQCKDLGCVYFATDELWCHLIDVVQVDFTNTEGWSHGFGVESPAEERVAHTVYVRAVTKPRIEKLGFDDHSHHFASLVDKRPASQPRS